MSLIRCLTLLIVFATPLLSSAAETRTLTRAELLDKIRAGWAGQMIGVVYGAATEFKALGHTFDDEIVPRPMTNAIGQDDLYVEMTFAHVMDTIGLDATTADYGEAFKNTEYLLWHANAAARRNLNRGIKAPDSGHPRYSLHSDDIDFQIEADFIGLMCPGLPQAVNHYAERVGRVMNHGEGLFGGMFVGGMYAAAFFEKDPRRVVEAGLACIPAESPYAAIIRDVLAWSAQHPDDWRRVWQLVEDKWNRGDICPDGAERPLNIDAKINGAYIAIGLLHGRGDWAATMEISTRCGQDSDCNPASACGILATMLGYEAIPEHHRIEVEKIADTKFDHTPYTFNDIVASTERRALEVIARAGGTIGADRVTIPFQAARAPAFEDSGYGRPVRVITIEENDWEWRGTWDVTSENPWGRPRLHRIANTAGCEVVLTFNGTGLGLVGDLGPDGGRAEVYVDGVKSDLIADGYVAKGTFDNDLWRIQGLAPGEHTVRIVTLDDADPRSSGKVIRIARAVVFQATR